jgi:hypothetical protein
MAYAIRQNPWKDELWNVSLLPAVKTAPPTQPPRGPGPAGGKSLETPALLSVSEAAEAPNLARAA